MNEQVKWDSPQSIEVQNYPCGHCGKTVASERGLQGQYGGRGRGAFLAICPHCSFPTFLRFSGEQVPGCRPGNDVGGIDDDSVLRMYNEARDCGAAGANTAAVLCCRKILMHVAVNKGARAGESFVQYVDYLAQIGYIPPDGADWVDHIRKAGNEANHDISIATRETAEELLGFVEMLLKFVYEFPHRMRGRSDATAQQP